MNTTEISTDLTPTSEELIKSFKNLVINCSGDLQTLGKFEEILNNEIGRLSDSSEDEFVPIVQDQEVEANPEDISPGIEVTPELITAQKKPVDERNVQIESLDDLVDFEFEYISSQNLKEVKTDLNEIFRVNNSKYVWLSTRSCTYNFGRRSLKSKDITNSSDILRLMMKLNDNLGLKLDSCLITRYNKPSDLLSRHQDNEYIFDPMHPICNVSVGSLRQIQFWDTEIEGTGNLVKHIYLTEGSLLTMKPGCQQKLWHQVLKGDAGTRYCLSFRKLEVSKEPTTPDFMTVPFFTANNHSTPILASGTQLPPPSITGTPLLPPPNSPGHFHDNFQLPLRVSIPTEEVPLAPPTSKDTLISLPPADDNTLHPQSVPAIRPIPLPALQPLINGFPIHPDRMAKVEHQNFTPSTPPTHLIIGDSLVKGLDVPESLHICKGGIHPHQIIQLLAGSTDVLPPDSYDNIRTVTLVVGTNALNVSNFSNVTPLLDVIKNYNDLILDLKMFFPNARIGLFNVIPRAYSTRETLHRIELFNSLFSQHAVETIPNVVWIKLYWDFIDNFGYLRQDLYGVKGVHLKYKGKKLMAHAILNFQQAYY